MKRVIFLFIFVIAFSGFGKLFSQEDVKSLFEKSWVANDNDEKYSLREKIVKISPESEYGLFCRAWMFTINKDNNSAIALYSKAIEKSNVFWQAYFNRGLAYSENYNTEKAISDFSKVIEIIPTEELAYYNRGKLYDVQNYNKAILDFSRAVEINPSFEFAYYARGMVYKSIKAYTKAIYDFNKTLEVNPDNSDARIALNDYDIKNYQKSIEPYNKEVEANPNDAKAYYNRGIEFLRLQDNYQAVEDFTIVIGLNPYYPKIYYNRGLAYFGLYEYNEAISDFTKELEVFPPYAEVYSKRGLAYKELKKNDEALKDFAKAKEIDPNYYPPDNKKYSEVTIGQQTWMSENLNVERYRNGDIIPQVQDAEEWSNLTTGAWCYYENDTENGKKYGKLYNWYAVNDSRGLAPKGWHIPTDAEWTKLTDYLGGGDVAGKKLKSTSGWYENGNGTNSSGFTAFPGGYRHNYGLFGNIGRGGFFWSASVCSNNYAWYRDLSYGYSDVSRYSNYKNYGFSVRCVRD